MSFSGALATWPEDRIRPMIDCATRDDVQRALAAEQRSPGDLAALLSPAALPLLEDIAAEAQRLTRAQFGRTIGLYIPLYLSNVCGADCAYCSYATGSGAAETRRTLALDEIRAECRTLQALGFKTVLLLTGEAPRAVGVDVIARAVEVAREYFPAVCVEIYSLDAGGYQKLVEHGLEGVTLYQETYHRPTYARVHLRGQKTDYRSRLDAIEHAGRANARNLSIGALLGLFDWQVDGFWTALHARYLQKECWRSSVSVSFPRLRNVPERFTISRPLADRDLVQLMLAMRLFVPQAGFNLSTREPASLRDKLIPLGVTMMSAGSSTRPGGYGSTARDTLAQFEVEDSRSPAAVAAAIRAAGYDPVWKDFDRAFHLDTVVGE
jgi:2-iminoacetate synthase